MLRRAGAGNCTPWELDVANWVTVDRKASGCRRTLADQTAGSENDIVRSCASRLPDVATTLTSPPRPTDADDSAPSGTDDTPTKIGKFGGRPDQSQGLWRARSHARALGLVPDLKTRLLLALALPGNCSGGSYLALRPLTEPLEPVSSMDLVSGSLFDFRLLRNA